MKLDKVEGQPDDKVAWGSDVAAQMLRRFGIPYMSLTPGASYRGFHDSVVNHLGNKDPGMILCLHEDQAVAVAHGWSKVTGKPMACALHSNVGLIHGMMSIFNAWCDRTPMLAPHDDANATVMANPISNIIPGARERISLTAPVRNGRPPHRYITVPSTGGTHSTPGTSGTV